MSPLLWRSVLRHLAHHPWQLGLSILGIALGVAVVAREQGVAIELTLETAKPPVLQGESGLSQKSAEPGNAS